MVIAEHFWDKTLAKEVSKRPLVVQDMYDCYNTAGTTVFTIHGSPPKGIAILKRFPYDDKRVGDLIILRLADYRTKIIRDVIIE